tara:strand:- start:641 stop:862 length:222 start_codon:yes stop_codon:yes gene_type:complete
MEYEVIRCGQGRDGRSFYPVGKIVKLDEGYAKHLVGRGILKQSSGEKKVVRKTKVSKKETANAKTPAMETPEA